MDEKTAKILVQGLKDCFVRTPGSDIGGIEDIKNIADAVALMAYAFRVMYISFGAGQMSLKEGADLKLEGSMDRITNSLSGIAEAIDRLGKE